MKPQQFARLRQAKALLASGHAAVRTDISRAIADFETSRAQFEQLGNTVEAAVAEIWALQFLRDVGRIDEARRRLTAFIESAGRLRFKVLLPTAYYWLAMSEYSQNQISESNRNLRAGLREAELSHNTFEVQHLQEALTAGYADFFEFDPALIYAGMMIGERGLYFQNRSQYWRDKGTLAELAVKLGYFATALGFSKESLATIEESNPVSYLINDALANLIAVAAATDDLTTALALANESLRIAQSRERNAETTRLVAGIHLSRADIKRKAGDCVGALADYDLALAQFADLPEFTDSLYQIHKGKLFCFQHLKLQTDFAAELKTVLARAETYRTTIREDDSRQAFFAGEQVVFDAAAANALDQGDKAAAFAFAESSRARSLLAFVATDKSIAEAERTFGGFAMPLNLTDIQARLPVEVQLVQYAVLPDRLAIWVVSRSRFSYSEQRISRVELERKIINYQDALLAKRSAAELKPAARELYELLLPAGLEPGKQLCLIPDKSLHQLAFAALVSPGGKYLIEEYALLAAPSASVLIASTENGRRRGSTANESLLSVGDPDFDRDENLNLSDLRAAQEEARAVTRDYPKAILQLGTEATKKKFLHDFTGVEVIHFAGHFVANRRSPGNSKLLFAGGDLRTSELGDYKLPRAKLVVLSACETGFERYNASEGAIGIARTFLALGAPAVVATQWKVDSEPTRDLMIAFHRNRKERGLVTAEALRQAQLEMLRGNSAPAPFYWAAFTLFGGYANY